jgi:hypothetical protein
MRHRRDDLYPSDSVCLGNLPGEPLSEKWSTTDCHTCLTVGAAMGNKTAAGRLAVVQAKPTKVAASVSAYVDDMPDSQRGFMGSSYHGWSELWD